MSLTECGQSNRPIQKTIVISALCTSMERCCYDSFWYPAVQVRLFWLNTGSMGEWFWWVGAFLSRAGLTIRGPHTNARRGPLFSPFLPPLFFSPPLPSPPFPSPFVPFGCSDTSGGASAAEDPGNCEVRTSSSQVTRMHFFPQKSWRPFF